MPEYLAPGVFVEEVSFRAKSIEGVATSTTGFAGITRYGPVRYANGPEPITPRLVTSLTEYERVFGGLEPLIIDGAERVNYMGHAARAFFLNGGQRLYVARVFNRLTDQDVGVASLLVPVGGQNDPDATWRARWPGRAGNVLVETRSVRSRNIAIGLADARQASGARHGALVEELTRQQANELDTAIATDPPGANAALNAGRLRVVSVNADGRQTFRDRTGAQISLGADSELRLVELTVSVVVSPDRVDVYDGLGTHAQHKRAVTRILSQDDPADEDAVVRLQWVATGSEAEMATKAIDLAVGLTTLRTKRLTGGNDGRRLTVPELTGKPSDPNNPKPSGLNALADIEDIAIVAAPDSGDLGDGNTSREAADALIAHADACRYRIAIVDGPKSSSLGAIREFRGKLDSTRAALYHPWVIVLDPLQPATQGAPPPQIALPPSGFVAGIYARSDVERGVWKAPANEVVHGITRFEANINTGRQQVLNPEGINALRFFEGRGNRVWGARTASSDPEWKYVNVRRLFIYLERSIDVSTQWAVFEPNGERLWANIRQAVEDFLLNEWKNGALLGSKPEQAYFVRCDRTTMTQNDLDNGRLICLVGVAPVRPAEFVIFRIGQWTADSAFA